MSVPGGMARHRAMAPVSLHDHRRTRRLHPSSTGSLYGPYMIQRLLYDRGVSASYADLDAIARLGRAIADPTRCRILLALAESSTYPAKLAVALGLTRPNVSNHL